MPPERPRGAIQCQINSRPAQILFKVACGISALQVSDNAIKSRFFSLVRSERNLYFFGSAKPLQF